MPVVRGPDYLFCKVGRHCQIRVLLAAVVSLCAHNGPAPLRRTSMYQVTYDWYFIPRFEDVFLGIQVDIVSVDRFLVGNF